MQDCKNDIQSLYFFLQLIKSHLQEHAFGHNRGTDCLIASCCRAWAKGEEEEVDEGRGEHQEQSAPEKVALGHLS